jgi:phosphatidylglycerol lysyltransferase
MDLGSPFSLPLKDSGHCEKLRLQRHLQSFWMLKGKRAQMTARLPTLRGNGNRLRAALVPLAALITLAGGAANLYSALNPLPPAEQRLMRDLPPLEFQHFPRSVAMLIGLALVVSAISIWKRRRRAFQIVFAMSLASVFIHLLKGPDYAQAAWSLLLAGLLLYARRSFTVRSRKPDWRLITARIGAAALAAFGYGAVGFWLLDEREFGINFGWLDSLRRTMLYLTFIGDASLVPRTRDAAWFLDSLYALSATVIVYTIFALYRPVVYRFHTLPQERLRAKELLSLYGRASLDFFKLWPDKSWFFNSAGNCFIAYSVGANFAIALSDPVGPEEEIEATVAGFRRYCEDNGWGVAFYQTSPDLLPVYRRLGFKKLKIGDTAIVNLTGFNLEGRTMKYFRQKIRQLEHSGVRIRHYDAPISDETLGKLKEVSDEWLKIPGRRERAFSLGRFEPGYLRSTPVVTAEDAEGRVLAFVNRIPSYRAGEATVDLMRHRADAPNGIMDYLFVKLMLRCNEQGFTRFNLGMAPMSGFREREEAGAAERATHLFFQRLNFLFSFSGLKRYKAKFATDWEPCYVIYRHALDLPKLGIALSKVSELNERRSDQSVPGEAVRKFPRLPEIPLYAQTPQTGKNDYSG